MTIYLIRHGQSEFNAAFAADGKDPMIRDAPLTALGLAQARQVREKAAELNIQLVIASPLTRALQTAIAIFEGIAPIRVMTGHHERIEHWCDVGRTPEQLQGDFPALSFEHLDEIWWHQGPENETGVPVEPKDVFSVRIDQFRANLNSLTDRPVAIVGHCNTFKELAGFDMANCELRQYTI
jgi:broad specificity phosphatase PhoE